MRSAVKNLVVATVVAGGLALGGAWLLAESPSPAGRARSEAGDVVRTPGGVAGRSATGSSLAPGAAALAPSTADGLAPGAVHRWRLEAEQRLHFTGRPAVQVRLAGELESFVVARDGAAAEVALQLHAPRLDVGAEQPAPAPLAAALASPFAVRLDADGRVAAVRFAPGTDPQARALLRGVAALVQAQRGAGAAWTVAEPDATGTCEMAYRVTAADAVEKRCLRYQTPETDAGPAATLVPSGLTTVRLGADGRPAQVTARTGLSGGLQGMRFESSLHAELVLVSTEHAPHRAPPSGLTAASALHAPEPLAVPVNTRPVAEVLAALAAVTEAGEARAALQVALEQGLRAHPEHTAAAVAAARAGSAAQAAPILAALAAAGTPEAQAGLLDLARDAGLAPERRSDALSLCALVAQPTPETVAGLTALSAGEGQEAETAALALGAAAGRLEGEAAEDLIDLLLRRFFEAPDAEAALVALVALGNTASPRILPAVRQGLASPLPTLRATAVRALRLVPDATADAILTAALLTDAAAEVRLSVVESLAHRPIERHLSPLHRALQADTEAAVRLAAVQLAGLRLDVAPRLAGALAWNAEHDPDPQVQRAAARILGYEEPVAE